MSHPSASLQEVCTFRHGGTPSKSNPAFWGGDIPWISPKDMKLPVLASAQDSITAQGVEESATSVVPTGSILVVARSGILAHTFPVARAGCPVAFNQDIKAIQVSSDKVSNEYVYWFLRGKEPEVLSRGVKKGATVHSLQSGFLERLVIPLAPIDEQRRIVDLLSRAENIVRMRKEAEAKAKEVIPALFEEMFGDPASHVDRDPPGASREAVQNVRLGDVLALAEYGTSTKAHDSGPGVPMIRIGNVDTTGRTHLDDIKYVDLPDDQIEKYRLLPGDILFNRTNSKELVGKTGIWRGECEAVAASYFIRLRVCTDIVAPDYVWAFMNTPAMKRTLFGMARGAIGQSNINAKELRSISIPVPSLSRQRIFAGHVVEALALERQQSIATVQSERMFQSLLAGVFGEPR